MPEQPDENFRPYSQSTPLRAGRGRGRGRNRRNNYHHQPMNHNRGSPRNNGDGRAGYGGQQNRSFSQDARFSNGYANGDSNGSMDSSHNNSSVPDDSQEGNMFYEDSGCSSPYQVPRPEPEDIPLRDEDMDPYLDESMLDDPWKDFAEHKELDGSANGTTNGTTNGEH